MISTLIWLLVLVLIFGLIWYAITLLPLPPPFPMIAQIIIIVIFILILVSMLTEIVPIPWSRSLR